VLPPWPAPVTPAWAAAEHHWLTRPGGVVNRSVDLRISRGWLLVVDVVGGPGKYGEFMPRTKNILSYRSDGSILSIYSKDSILSVGSIGSVLSVASVGSILSVLSCGSFGSVVSIASFGSILSIGAVATAVMTGSYVSAGVVLGAALLGIVLIRVILRHVGEARRHALAGPGGTTRSLLNQSRRAPVESAARS
jgi:hypothetical protein